MAETKSITEKAAGWPQAIKNYVQELQMEMRLVTWPSWKQVRSTTAVVIAAVFAFAVYFFVVDFAVNNTITKLFNTLTR